MSSPAEVASNPKGGGALEGIGEKFSPDLYTGTVTFNRVETIVSFSGGKLTTEYSYHHGYWDGFEWEFRGFGRVDHRDTEVFSGHSGVPPQYFSAPTETRTWFHQGAVGDRFDGWAESDSLPGRKHFAHEYYQQPPVINRVHKFFVARSSDDKVYHQA
jgi:hypothetical protein